MYLTSKSHDDVTSVRSFIRSVWNKFADELLA